MADEAQATKRVELIDQAGEAADGLPGYIGVGLIGGVVLGFGPLRDAVQGVGPFEDAMLRFLACFLVCIVAASFIGRILDSAPPAPDGAESVDDRSPRESSPAETSPGTSTTTD